MNIRPAARMATLPATMILTALALTGCANMVTTASETNAFSTPGTMTGSIHGGQQPISGASLKLYSVGTSGYGSAGTLLATTTSDTSGNFAYKQVTSGATGPSGNTYVCPSSSALIYIISTGGNTQGSGSSTNGAAVFLAAVGACGTSGSTVINVNEITSYASIAALAQYINPGTSTPGSATVGSPNTTQALLGISNAFATVPNLVTLAPGTAVTSFTPTTGSGAAGVTVTGTPESTKLNTVADILAACVNSVTSSGTNCTTLFANAVPPSSATVTSQPTATFPTAVDTLQAGYYMAINPADLTTADQTNTKLTALFGLAASSPPFQPTLSSAPSDWTLGITYTSAGTCTNATTGVSPNPGATFMGSMESIAIDATGNVWFNNGSTTAINALGALSPTGAAKVCAFGAIPAGRGLTIDTNGNVWTTSSTTGSTTGVYEYLAGGTTLNWTTTNGANGIFADGAGDIFYLPSGTTAVPIQEFVSAASASAIAAGQPVGGSLTASTGLLYGAIDSSSRLWAPSTGSAVVWELYPGGATPTNGFTSVDAGTTPLTTAVVNNGYGGAIDASGNIFGGSTCCAATASNTFFKIVPGSTAGSPTGSISNKFAGGLVAPRSTAVDGAGNVWAGMGYPTQTATISPTGVAIYALAEVDNNMNSISYSGPNGATGPAICSSTNTNCPSQGGFEKATLGTVRSLAIDPSGNVWAASNGTAQSIVEVVGAAVPVVTPLSIAIKNSTLGTKP
jgi:hypothetical protein